jgi:hypothetical protein
VVQARREDVVGAVADAKHRVILIPQAAYNFRLAPAWIRAEVRILANGPSADFGQSSREPSKNEQAMSE